MIIAQISKFSIFKKFQTVVQMIGKLLVAEITVSHSQNECEYEILFLVEISLLMRIALLGVHFIFEALIYHQNERNGICGTGIDRE